VASSRFLASAPSTSSAASLWKKMEEQSRKNEELLKRMSRRGSAYASWTRGGRGRDWKTWVQSFGPSVLAGLAGATLTAFLLAKEVQCAGKEDGDCIERKCGDSDCLRKTDHEEEMIQRANSELEKALKDVKPKAVDYTEAALKAFCEATELIRQFMDKVYCAIEEDNLQSPRFEEVWCDVYDTSLKRCEKVKEALVKAQCAWEMLCRLREIIEAGKACKYTACNPLLITAEEALLCAERELLNAKAKMECMQSESHLVEQYKTAIEDFRRELKAEMESRPECCEKECSPLIEAAYKKVLRIQKELAQTQICSGCIPERLQCTLC